MKNHILATSVGFIVTIAATAMPLWWMRGRQPQTSLIPVIASAPSMPMRVLASDDPLAKWHSARTAGSSGHHAREAARAFDTLDAVGCQRAAEALLGESFDNKDSSWRDLFVRWAALDARSALDWALAHPEVPARALNDAGTLWAQRDPVAAASWARAAAQDAAVRKRLQKWPPAAWFARSDPATGVALFLAVARLNENDGCPSFVTEAVHDLGSARRFAAVLAALDPVALPTKAHNTLYSLCGGLRTRWMRYAPQEWLAWIKSHPLWKSHILGGAPSDDHKLLFPAATEENRPAAATAWLDAAKSEKRSTTLAEIIKSWAPNDIDAAGIWLGQQPIGSDTTEAVQAFIHEAAVLDPEAAFTWAASLSDPSSRTAAERIAWLRWHEHDASAAEEWLTGSSGWPVESVEEMRERVAVRIR